MTEWRTRSNLSRGSLATALALGLFGSISNASIAAAPSTATTESAASQFSYADIADLADGATAIIVARPRSFVPVPPERANGLRAGTSRFYVEADLMTLIRNQQAMPKRIAFLIDLAPGQDKAMKRKTFIFFGTSDPAGNFQLRRSDAVLPWSPPTEAKVRAITAEFLKADAPPAIARIQEAFHVAGTVAGEGETQVFLATRGDRPISLSIVRRPDEQPKFGAALGEIVDEAADIPPKDTLLWYRLACGLPSELTPDALAKLQASDADAARIDYKAFVDQLGACQRTRGPLGNAPSPG